MVITIDPGGCDDDGIDVGILGVETHAEGSEDLQIPEELFLAVR
jgi:hypothetical protein